MLLIENQAKRWLYISEETENLDIANWTNLLDLQFKQKEEYVERYQKPNEETEKKEKQK